jgi:hypothetical protein
LQVGTLRLILSSKEGQNLDPKKTLIKKKASAYCLLTLKSQMHKDNFNQLQEKKTLET